MNELALFAGAGGGLLGSRLLGWRTVCYVERDPYCVKVIQARIRDGYLDDAPIWDDASTFDGRPWAGRVDIVSAGFPCQPFSLAGKRLAEQDERNGWPATIKIIRQVRPGLAFLENVPGLVSHGYFGTILGDLAEAGYRVEWRCISAAEVGANHKRDRLWIIANANSCTRPLAAIAGIQTKALEPARHGSSQPLADAEEQYGTIDGQSASEPGRRSKAVADAPGGGQQESHAQLSSEQSNAARRCESLAYANSGRRGQLDAASVAAGSGQSAGIPDSGGRNGWWEIEPQLGRVANGVAYRVDRLRAIGNGQVPAVVRRAWIDLTGGNK